MSEHQGRLPLLAPEALDASQRDLYASIAEGPRATGPFSIIDSAGRLAGPFNALLHSPAIGSAVERLGAALRFSGDLDARTRELVICTVAAHWDSAYEWYAHERVAHEVGVRAAELEAVRAGVVPDDIPAAAAAALELASALLRERAVGPELYERVVDHHGPSGLVEICTVVGYYQLLAGLLAAADVGVPDDHHQEGTT